MDRFIFALTVAAAIGSGLIAGTFFVFSAAVMPAFRQLPADSAMAAMKRINEVILNPIFLGVFVGTAVVALGLSVWCVLNWGRPGVVYLLAGSFFYVAGTFGVTVVFNVPMNNTLARSDDPEAWSTYAPRWTLWNHIRALASTAATGAFTLAAANLQ